jgi:hypothetical protein
MVTIPKSAHQSKLRPNAATITDGFMYSHKQLLWPHLMFGGKH